MNHFVSTVVIGRMGDPPTAEQVLASPVLNCHFEKNGPKFAISPSFPNLFLKGNYPYLNRFRGAQAVQVK